LATVSVYIIRSWYIHFARKI